MNRRTTWCCIIAIACGVLLGYLAAGGKLVLLLHAQETPAAPKRAPAPPGSPSATTTIDGRYLPNPPPKFGGEINLNANQSRPWWPPRVVPPTGAPNVLLIMTDDVGFGAASTFGGVIHTPEMGRGQCRDTTR